MNLDPLEAYVDDHITEGVHHPYTAYNQGHDAGLLHHHHRLNPYPEGSREFRFWRSGWADAQYPRTCQQELVSVEREDNWPKQGWPLGERVTVCTHYNSPEEQGIVVRADVEEPGLMIIQLDSGRVVLSSECLWAPVKQDMPITTMPTRAVLLLASYCGPDDKGCTDALPCPACLRMSNIALAQVRLIEVTGGWEYERQRKHLRFIRKEKLRRRMRLK